MTTQETEASPAMRECRPVENAIYAGLVEAFGDNVGADRCWVTAIAIADGLGLSGLTTSGLSSAIGVAVRAASDEIPRGIHDGSQHVEWIRTGSVS